MSTTADIDIDIAKDGFERHYAEKIWALIPEVYRNEDGLAREPGKLRAFVEILAEQAAIARRSSDRLWADTRVDEADDWAARLRELTDSPEQRDSLGRGAIEHAAGFSWDRAADETEAWLDAALSGHGGRV